LPTEVVMTTLHEVGSTSKFISCKVRISADSMQLADTAYVGGS